MSNQTFLKTVFVLLFLIFLMGCNFSSNKNVNNSSNSQNTDTGNPDNTKPSEIIEEGESQSIIRVPQYFWGTWQRMDNGQYYVIDENEVTFKNQNYVITSSTETSLNVNNLGVFEKQSDSVMVNNSIPYFRKGGTNLEYTMKLVGFEDDISRAAGSLNLSDFKVKGKSEKYKSFESDSNVSEDGTIKLIAPTAGDIQTITVSSESDVVAVVPGITVETKDSNMGTIPISSKGQYSLKVTGTIPDEEKDDGYLYGNNYKSYPMTITITNVSEVDSETSAISINPNSNIITIHSEDDLNLDLITVSTMKSGMSKTVKLFVECGSVSSGYIDTGINVTITNLKTRKQWIDFIPLRFYKGLVPLTITAKSTESNNNAALNGFIIYPDGNNSFFAIPSGGDKTIFVPSFGLLQDYLLVFSGATVEGSLSLSTEMFYTVNPGSSEALDVQIPVDLNSLLEIYDFAESNDLETNAYYTNESFTAYLSSEDIDYYLMKADSDEIILPSGTAVCKIHFVNSKGNSPNPVTITEGQSISDAELPELADISAYSFDGWYLGSYKITTGYKVFCNMTLEAKWIPNEYEIEYHLNGGTNSNSNPAEYTIESDTISLEDPSRDGYNFEGWYESEEFSGDVISKIASGNYGKKKFYAKWSPKEYSINYELNGGILIDDIPGFYNREDDDLILSAPIKKGYTFAGWYSDNSFSDSYILTIPKGSSGNKSIYAKWIKPDIGDVVLGDNRLIKPYCFIKDKMEAIAVLAYWNDNNDYYGVGIYNSGEIIYEWCSRDSILYDTKFHLENLGCYIEMFTSSLGNKSYSFKTSDNNPSDDWEYICSIDETAQSSAATKYPAFNYVNNYKNKIISHIYKDGWHLPSAKELYCLYSYIDVVNDSLSVIGGDILVKNRDYWTSSGINQVASGAACRTVEGGFTMAFNLNDCSYYGDGYDGCIVQAPKVSYYSRDVKHTVCAFIKIQQ